MDVNELKELSRGREIDVLINVAGIDRNYLTGRHTPCPKCGGHDRFRLIDETSGAVFCNKCFSEKNGDFIAAVMWMLDVSFKEAITAIANYLGIQNLTTSTPAVKLSTIEYICRSKRMPVDGFMRFEPVEAARYGCRVARIPAYDEQGKKCTHFDVTSGESKGWFIKDGGSGLFFPGKLPQPGEAWLLVEGVKDAAALVGLGFNAAGLPTKQMNKKYARLFLGCGVVLIYDLDSAGFNGAQKSASNLFGIADVVKICRLPGGIVESDGEDVRDILAQPDGENQVRDAIKNAVPWLPKKKPDSASNGQGTSDQSETEKEVANFCLITDDDGKERKEPLPMESIRFYANALTDDWPRLTAATLFVHEKQQIQFLERTPALFGYLHSKIGRVNWAGGTGYVTKEEYFHESKRGALRYDAVEGFPHVPPLKNHYYCCSEFPPGDGSRLQDLLDRFCPDEPIDRDLILAAMLTLLWGGRGGSRPCFVITAKGRGCGKSTLVELLSLIFGGFIDFTSGEDFGQVKQRLLSNEALTKRVCLLDNVKTYRLSWAELEGLVTSQTVSGKKMYTGEAQRPNTLCWFVTLNGAFLSKDLAQRSVIIKLARPTHSGSWKDDIVNFIENHRDELICDLVAEFEREALLLQDFSRWGDWERDVLARLPDPIESQRVIRERQAEVDTDSEESSVFVDFIKEELASLTYRPESVVFIPSRVLCDFYNDVFREHKSTNAVTRLVKQWIEERTISELAVSRRSVSRGFVFVPDGVRNENPNFDIEERIDRRRQK